MRDRWVDCKRILCVRPDNMGDLIMSGPAIRALKESFDAHITVLTSYAAKSVTKHMPEIDEVLVFDMPWVKTDCIPGKEVIFHVVEALKIRKFDAAVIFTVYSQNPLPTAMLAYMAGIPRVLAYCRENPYGLLTHWVPDQEPYRFIRHQVRRDLELVKTVGAVPACEKLSLKVNDHRKNIFQKLEATGFEKNKPWLMLHPGVSEIKRQFPFERWVSAARKIIADTHCQVLLTGSASEQKLTRQMQAAVGKYCYNVAGIFSLDEFICLVKQTPLIISVNTGPVHIAAAVGTTVLVLYAQTNPQHIPWQVPCKVLQFPVAEELQSSNEVIRNVSRKLYAQPADMPGANDIVSAIQELLSSTGSSIPASHVIPLQNQEIGAS